MLCHSTLDPLISNVSSLLLVEIQNYSGTTVRGAIKAIILLLIYSSRSCCWSVPLGRLVKPHDHMLLLHFPLQQFISVPKETQYCKGTASYQYTDIKNIQCFHKSKTQNSPWVRVIYSLAVTHTYLVLYSRPL